jgi:hypothetical protein
MFAHAQLMICALAIAPLVSAHGKVAVVTGNLGGNGTALGIKGASVPLTGPNYKTEVDTTVFWSKDIKTDNDIGYTDEAGNNKLTDLVSAMDMSGSTLPQVNSGGSVNGTYTIVTTDGAGPLQALVDESATGKWSTAKSASVTTQPPGTNGNIAARTVGVIYQRSIWTRSLEKMGLVAQRAENVGKDYVSVWPLKLTSHF